MSEFTLEPDKGPDGRTVTSGTLARSHGVSTQTIANYRNQGMPTAGSDGKAYLYDPAVCAVWIKENTRGKLHGGDREGAGRKPGRKPGPKPGRRKDTADPNFAAGVDAARAKADAAGRRPDLVHVDDLLQITHDDLVKICALDVEVSGLNKAQLERLKLIQEARARERSEREKLGELVEAAELRAAYTRELAGLREKLEQLPQRLLRAVMSAGAVEPQREHDVLDALRREIDGLVGMVAEEHGQDAIAA